MPSPDRKQVEEAREREPEDGPLACELRPFAHPVSDALVLAAAERAERHKPRGGQGVMLGDVFAHMGFLYNGAATRQLRPRLDALLSAGALEHTRRHGIKLWVLTSKGRRRLAQARRKGDAVELPESPQHRKWRHSRAPPVNRSRDTARSCVLCSMRPTRYSTQARGLTRICGSASPNVSRPRPRTSGRRFIA